MSPCLLHMKETLSENLELLEPIAFSLKYLVPRLEFSPLDEKITVHATCSTTKMGLDKELEKLALIVCPRGSGSRPGRLLRLGRRSRVHPPRTESCSSAPT
jgi:hypothetical protein